VIIAMLQIIKSNNKLLISFDVWSDAIIDCHHDGCAAGKAHRRHWFKGGRHFEDTWIPNSC